VLEILSNLKHATAHFLLRFMMLILFNQWCEFGAGQSVCLKIQK